MNFRNTAHYSYNDAKQERWLRYVLFLLILLLAGLLVSASIYDFTVQVSRWLVRF